jgi:3-keto-5-aminohexanoate cleavage enzyme
MKINMIDPDKVIITAAITGGVHGKFANEALPQQPDEQAQAAYDCYNAGAAVVHLHVRDKRGFSTPDLNVYNEVITKIRQRCPIICQVGNGIGAIVDENWDHRLASQEERVNLLNIEPKPEMLTINAGTFTFVTNLGNSLFLNPPEFNEEFVTGCNQRGIGVECEVYDVGHVANVLNLVEKGILKTPVHFSFVLGIGGGIPATPQNLLRLVDEIPDGSSWQVITIGKYHLPMTMLGLSMGANIRTGLEDTIYYSKGELAGSNAQLVERVVRMAHEMGREVATMEEAKQMLHLS